MHNPDVDCDGLVNTITNTSFYILLITTIAIALIAIFRKRQSNKFRADPISLLLVVSSLFTLIFYAKMQGHTNGEKWIAAENRNINHALSTQELLLRKNGHYTIHLYEADFGCSISGSYTKKGDTIFFEEESVVKTSPNISPVYLIQSNKLIPLFDTMNKITFTIRELTP
jgi:hypothetical protein